MDNPLLQPTIDFKSTPCVHGTFSNRNFHLPDFGCLVEGQHSLLDHRVGHHRVTVRRWFVRVMKPTPSTLSATHSTLLAAHSTLQVAHLLQLPAVSSFAVLANFTRWRLQPWIRFCCRPTFIRVYRKKSTESFHSLPYVCGLFSAMFWLYYGLIKPDCTLLITINSAGCIIETLYIAIYSAYAPPHAKRTTARLLVLLNIGVFGFVVLFTLLFSHDRRRILIVGWTSSAISVAVYAAPLSIVRLVICTKSVEFMPFYLSFFLTINATIWFAYGFLLGDMFVALPNVLGFLFGILQMTVYLIYRNEKQVRDEKPVEHSAGKLNTLSHSEVHPIDIQLALSTLSSFEVHPIDIQVALNNNDHKPTNTMDSNPHAAGYEKPLELPV